MPSHDFCNIVDGFSCMANHRNCLNCLILLLTVTAAVLLRLLYIISYDLKTASISYQYMGVSTSSNKLRVWSSGAWPHNTYGFHPVNEKGIYSFWNVCIEAQPDQVVREIDYLGKKIYFNEMKKIVVYDSYYRNGLQKLYVAGSHNSPWNHWDLQFTRSSIPLTHTFHNTTAFFITQTCPVNFHHFWIDEFVPLYCVVRLANRFYDGASNQIIYRLPSNLTIASSRGCYSKTVFEDVLKTLYTTSFHDVFYEMKTNSCFSSAVFGMHAAIDRPRVIADHVLRQLGASVPNILDSYITLIQRTHRRIINIHEILEDLKLQGFQRSRIVNFEKLDVKAQAQVAASSRVMIGVQGAGLQWAVFMPQNSCLIEIAWPHKFWGFYFKNYVTQYDIQHHELIASHVRVNWTSYELLVRGGNPVSTEEKFQLLQSQPKTTSLDNIWKWADVLINKDELKNIISKNDFRYLYN